MRTLTHCTFADLLDPARFDGSDEHAKLIRQSIVYGLHRIVGTTRALMAIKRDYRPIGSDLLHGDGRDLDFREFTGAHFPLEDLKLEAGQDPTRPGFSWLTPTWAGFFLWCDSSAPYRNPVTLARYRVALLDVIGPAGVARVASLNGRDLGPFPDRAAAWEELISQMERSY